MPRMTRLPLAGVLLASMFALFSFGESASARSVTWARSGDAPTLDPHAADDGFAVTLNQQIYEPLVQRDGQGKTVPALAESWSPTSDPLVWEFRLRRYVTFHDGTPFTSEDVVFSIQRGKDAAAGVSPLLQSIDQVTAVDSHLVRIRTRGPTPLLPASLTHLLVVSKAWTERNGAAKVVPEAQRARSHMYRQANGTGPFVLVSREIGARTVMRRNENYWGNAQSPIEIAELTYLPLPNDTERVQALVSGEVDFLQDVPVNELPRLQANKALTVSTGPENRSVFLGLNVAAQATAVSGDGGRNPLADKRVREAISRAINRQFIQRNVLNGQAIPTGTVAPPSTNGYPRALDRFPAFDVGRAKALLTDAGFPNGFPVRLDCPRDGFARSEAICRAIAVQLGQVGINVDLAIRPFAEHLGLIQKEPPGTNFYLFGMSVPSFDSEQILASLFHSRGDRYGRLNGTRFASADVDRLTQSISGQIDFTQRTQAIAQAWRIVQDEMIYVPLHIQTLAYATKSDLTIGVDIENQPKLKSAKIKLTTQ